MDEICVFKFKENIGKKAIEQCVAAAIFSAAHIFGSAKVQPLTKYVVTKNMAIINVGGETGEYIAKCFTGLMVYKRKIERASFTVDYI